MDETPNRPPTFKLPQPQAPRGAGPSRAPYRGEAATHEPILWFFFIGLFSVTVSFAFMYPIAYMPIGPKGLLWDYVLPFAFIGGGILPMVDWSLI